MAASKSTSLMLLLSLVQLTEHRNQPCLSSLSMTSFHRCAPPLLAREAFKKNKKYDDEFCEDKHNNATSV